MSTTASMTAPPFTDVKCQQAFEKFTGLLNRVQKGNPYRARGAELTKAKREYQEFLPELQPAGQYMLERACQALDKLRQALRLPEGYTMRDCGYPRNRAFKTFEAGIFQLNHDASLYIDGPGGRSQSIGEVRLFTQKVKASWLTSTSAIKKVGDSAFFHADDYDTMIDQIVQALQPRLDCLPPMATPYREDS